MPAIPQEKPVPLQIKFAVALIFLLVGVLSEIFLLEFRGRLAAAEQTAADLRAESVRAHIEAELAAMALADSDLTERRLPRANIQPPGEVERILAEAYRQPDHAFDFNYHMPDVFPAEDGVVAPGDDHWQHLITWPYLEDGPKSDPWIAIYRCAAWLLAALCATLCLNLFRLNRKLADVAPHDLLTGLPGRHLFIDRMRQMIRHTKRNSGRCSILFVNLRHLDDINRQHGQKVGSMMLAGIAKRLQGSIRHCDTVTRWSDDRFMILLDSCPGKQATMIADDFRHKIELPVAYGECELRVRASIGSATYPEDGRSLAALFKAAESRTSRDANHRERDAEPVDPNPTDEIGIC